MFMGWGRWRRLALAGAAACLGVVLIGPLLIPGAILRERAAAAVRKATGRSLAIKGPMSLRLLPRPGFTAESVTLSGPDGDAAAPLVSVRYMAAELSLGPLLRGRIELASVDLELVEVNLTRDAEGRANWIFRHAGVTQPSRREGLQSVALRAEAAEPPPQPLAPSIRLPDRLPVHALHLANARITYTDRARGESYTLDGVSLDLRAPDLQSRVTAHGLALWKDQRWRIDLGLSDPHSLVGGAGSAFDASIDAPDGKLALTGFAGLAGGLTGQLDASLRLAARQHGGPRPNRLGAIALAAHAAFAEGRFNLDVAPAQDPANALDLTGRLAVDLTGAHPVVTGNLDVGALDLDRLLPPVETDRAGMPALPAPVQDAAAEEPKKPPRPWRDATLKLGALQAAEVDLRLAVGPITLRETQIARTALRLGLVNGQAVLDLPETAVGPGQVAARVEIEQTAAADVAIRMAVQARRLPGDVLQLPGGASVDLDLRLATSGSSDRALIDALQGDAQLAINHATLPAAALGPALRRVLLPRPACPSIIDEAGVSATVYVAAGLATLSSFALRAPSLTLTAHGVVDLPNRSLDLHLDGAPADCVAPAAIRGYWNAPAARPDRG